MKIIQLTDYGSPYAGSFVPMMDAAVRGVRSRGWEPVVVLSQRARNRSWAPAFEAEHGSAVVYAPEGDGRRIGSWLDDLVSQSPGPTIVHTHFTRFDLGAAAFARRRADVRVVWHFHSVLSDALKARVRNRLRFALAGRYVSRMLCVAPHLVEGICRRGAPADRVQYFRNGLDTAAFPGRARGGERAAGRASLGIDESARVLLHVGRDWHLKGGDLFLDAIESLDDERTLGLMVRGGDVAQEEVDRRGLGDRVKVVAGASEIRRIYAASDAMLATSRGEGMPLAVLEALASGLPVIGTDIPGHELPGGGPPGFHLTQADPAAIASEATLALDRPTADAVRDSASAHAWVADEFGLDAWAEDLCQVYDEVAGDRRI